MAQSLKHVLWVEDDDNLRDLISDILKIEGYHVTATKNGIEALLYLKQMTHPDLILLDIIMPLMDGNELLSYLKNYPYLQNIPVIILSALDRKMYQFNSEYEFLEKPIELDLLLARIANHFISNSTPSTIMCSL